MFKAKQTKNKIKYNELRKKLTKRNEQFAPIHTQYANLLTTTTKTIKEKKLKYKQH